MKLKSSAGIVYSQRHDGIKTGRNWKCKRKGMGYIKRGIMRRTRKEKGGIKLLLKNTDILVKQLT